MLYDSYNVLCYLTVCLGHPPMAAYREQFISVL